jgi:hypothetical protein|tara:strand:+ start:1120 stop:1764 length:645 start_codon:yes stop_codon:yes gene_type:complete
MSQFYQTLGLKSDVDMKEACTRIDFLTSSLKKCNAERFVKQNMCSSKAQTSEQLQVLVDEFDRRGRQFLYISRGLLTSPSARWILNQKCRAQAGKLALSEKEKLSNMILWHNRVSDQLFAFDHDRLLSTIVWDEPTIDPIVAPTHEPVELKCAHCFLEMPEGILKVIKCPCSSLVVHSKCAQDFKDHYNGTCPACKGSAVVNNMTSYRQLFNTR